MRFKSRAAGSVGEASSSDEWKIMPRRHRRLWMWLGVSLVTAVAGCSLLTQTPPQVDVSAVAITAFAFLEQSLTVTLCVTNPNASQMVFQRVTFRLDVAGAPLADGATESGVAVPALASVLVPIAVETTTRNLADQLMSTVKAGSVTYRLDGVVHIVGLPFGIPFDRQGRLSVLHAGSLLADAAIDPSTTRCRTPPLPLESKQ